ncbi:MAG: hypothetical protein QM594_17200 [Niabella sp.]
MNEQLLKPFVHAWFILIGQFACRKKRHIRLYIVITLSMALGVAWFSYKRYKRRNQVQEKEQLSKENDVAVDTSESHAIATIHHNSDNLLIPEETKQRLLNGLNEFEDSKLFTSGNISLSYLSAHFNTNTKYLSYVIKSINKKISIIILTNRVLITSSKI